MRWIEATRNFDQKKKKAVYGIFFFLQSRRDLEEKVSHIFSPFSLSPTCRYAFEVCCLSPSICTLRLSSSSTRSACVGNVWPNKNEDGRQRVPTSAFFLFQIFFIVESMMGWFGAQLRFVLSFSFFFLYLAVWKLDKSSLTLVKYHLHHPASLSVLIDDLVCAFDLLLTPLARRGVAERTRGRIEGVIVVVVKAPSKQWCWCEALTQPASARRRCCCCCCKQFWLSSWIVLLVFRTHL